MSRRTQGTAAGPDPARITAAVTLVDRDGSEPFGARRLAQELRVAPMSIYHHIKGRAALLNAMPEAVFAEVAATSDDDTPRREEVARQTAHGYREMTYRHPGVPVAGDAPRLRRWPLRPEGTGHHDA